MLETIEIAPNSIQDIASPINKTLTGVAFEVNFGD
jgi:hypothetical protein